MAPGANTTKPEDYGKGDILGLVAYVAGLAPRSKEGRKHAIQWAKKRLGITDGNSDDHQENQARGGGAAQEGRQGRSRGGRPQGAARAGNSDAEQGRVA